MSIFLLRDGSFHCLSVLLEGVVTSTQRVRHLRRAHVPLVSDSEQTLLLVRSRLRVRRRLQGSDVDPPKYPKAA